MDFALFFQTLTTGLSGVAVWFIYEHIKDFKSFKKEAGQDIGALKKEREHFEFVIRSVGITITDKVHDLKDLHNDFKIVTKSQLNEVGLEMQKIKDMIIALDGKIKNQEDQLKQLKILLDVD